MDKYRMDVKSGRLFPWHFLFLAVVFSAFGLAIIGEHPLLSAFLLAGSVLVLSAHSGTDINIKEHVYREYMSFLFIKTGKWIKYQSMERIFINKTKLSQRAYTAHANQSSTFTHYEFNAYLKFEDGTKVHLLSNKSKEKMLQRVDTLAEFLRLPVVDTTESLA